MKKKNKFAAIATMALGLTGMAQAGTITGFSLVSQSSPSGNPASYIVSGSVGFTSNSISFSTPGVGVNNGFPDTATFTITTSGSIEGDNFIGCAAIAGTHDCTNDNVFGFGFGSSGPNAVINDTIEWSDPKGLTGQTVMAEYSTLNAPGNGSLVVQITGNQLQVWDFCPSSCGTTGLDFTFTDVGPTAPEPASIALSGSAFLVLGAIAYRRRRLTA